MLGRRDLLEPTTATPVLRAAMGRTSLGAAPIRVVGIHGTFGGFGTRGRPMAACLDPAGSDLNEVGGLLDAPCSPSNAARGTTSSPARGRRRRTGDVDARWLAPGAEAVRPAPRTGQSRGSTRAVSVRALLIHRGRLVPKPPAAGSDDPAPEHEFIG